MRAATFPWFAHHEARLAWRDWLAMIQGGRRRRKGIVAIVIILFVAGLHLLAYGVLQPYMTAFHADKKFLLILTGSMFLSWALLLSQAMESITRAFYGRADLDLLLSSPAPTRSIFMIRLGSIALTTSAMSVLLLSPAINVLALLGGAQFLAAYGVLLAMACSATAFAACIVVLLFCLIGPKATRLTSQIVAAIIGAGFVIGVQAVAIISYDGMSRFAVFQSPALIAAAPDLESVLWAPARAAMGDLPSLAGVGFISIGMLVGVIFVIAGGFARHALAVVSPSGAAAAWTSSDFAFRGRSVAQTLRRKEWMLLARDPWLLSQTLMQILYLAPPALLLWRSFGDGVGALAVLAPVLVMAAGQLSGGLAWLAISGEDAPDLVATAPVAPAALLRAKIEALIIVVAAPLTPLIVGLALASPWVAFVTALAAAYACACATAIQFIFRSQARRSNFRRRQTSSRIATFAEAFASISTAGAAGLAAVGSWAALAPALFALAVVLGARAMSTRRE